MRNPVAGIIIPILLIALLSGAFRRDLLGTASPDLPSSNQPSVVADLILTKYPDLPKQVVQRRVRELTSADWGSDATDCGGSGNGATQLTCARTALVDRKPFYVTYGGRTASYGLAGDRSGRTYMISYRVYPFAPIPPDRHTRILDRGHTMLTECVAPVALGQTEEGTLACITPINQELSVRAANQQPTHTTLCAIADDPASFNNKLVRVRGEVSGNFEYSTMEDRGCKADIWFAYATDDAGPPGFAAYVPGSAVPGAEDSEGKRILPVPLKLIQDSNFKRFQKLMEARAKADEASFRQSPKANTSYCVSATFLGRIDGVSPAIHAFHKKRSSTDRADYLGYGQMGLFDAQLVMQSVEKDAKLGVCCE